MSTYFFGNITDVQAAAYIASVDDLIFSQTGDQASATTVTQDAVTGAVTLVSGLTGKTVTFANLAGEKIFFPSSYLHIGGMGGDAVGGDSSSDVIYGFGGADTLSGGSGDDILDGGSGDDRLVGGAGGDTISGDGGADTFVITAGDSGVAAGAIDRVSDWSVGDRLAFGSGATAGSYLELTAGGYAEAKTLADAQIAGGAYNFVAVGVGSDVIVFADSRENNGGADDAILLAGRSLADIDATAIVAGAPAAPPVDTDSETLSGGSGPDSIDGGAGNDLINGGGDNDLLLGGSGGDSLHGDAGADRLTGGPGADALWGEAGADTYVFASGSSGVAPAGLDRIMDWEATDALSFGYNATATTYLELPATDYASALSAANAAIASLAADFVVAQIGSDLVVFADSGANDGAAEDAVVLVGRTLADISLANINALPPTAQPIEGTAGADTLPGTPDADTIDGAAGNDLLTGGEGADVILGGEDTDTLSGQGGADTLAGGGGDDSLNGGAGADSLSDGSGANTFVGGAGADTMTGSMDSDIFIIGAGDSGVTAGAIDVIENWATNPIFPQDYLVFSGASFTGTNYAVGSASTYAAALTVANGLIAGGSVDYVAVSVGANLYVFADTAGDNGAADDAVMLRGVYLTDFGTGNLTAPDAGPAGSGSGNQTLSGTSAGDTIAGGVGADSISAGDGADRLFGLDGADTVDGGAGADTIHGGAGDDRLQGGAGADLLSYIHSPAGGVSVSLAITTAQAVGAGQGVDIISGFENLEGTLFSDTLTGDEQANLIRGWAGGGELSGAGGADTLIGDDDSDDLTGGTGDDSLIGGGNTDVFILGAGADTVWIGIGDSGTDQPALDHIRDWSSEDKLRFGYVAGTYAETTASSYWLGFDAAEDLIAAGARYVSVEIGGEVYVFADTAADGGSPEDVVRLEGRTLADISVANLGSLTQNATLPAPPPPPPPPPPSGGGGGGGGGDIFPTPEERGSVGNDVRSLPDGQFSYDGGGGDDMITAGAASNLLFGGDGDDTISAGGGADTVVGGAGRSYLRGDEGDDRMLGGSDFDDINGNMGADTIMGGLGDDWVVGGKDNDIIFGEQGADLVYGNVGDDMIGGGVGNDIVRGGQGNDVCRGDDGDDYVSGDRGSDTMDGGLGADILHTFSEAGLDLVINFNAGDGDRVQVDPGTVYTVSQQGSNVVIDMGGDNRMILQNVQLSSLPEGWIFGA